MAKQKTFSDNVLEFNEWLANISLELFDNYAISNPFSGKNRVQIKEITHAFYKKYYNNHNKRYLILGSSPARKGTATTGIPFEDASHLYKETGIMIDNFYINKSSSDFLYDVMEQYGGCEKFYKNFFMSFVCPLGIVNINSKGNEVNSNYYENKKLENFLYNFIVDSLKRQIAFVIMKKYISKTLLEQTYINNLVLKDSKRIDLLEETLSKFKERSNHLFFEGQIYDAYSKINEIFRDAKKDLIIVDAYADITILDMIKKLSVDVIVITKQNGLLTNMDIKKYNNQYHNLTIKYSDAFHDRYFIIDNNKIYHCGTSINHAGARTFSINILRR